MKRCTDALIGLLLFMGQAAPSHAQVVGSITTLFDDLRSEPSIAVQGSDVLLIAPGWDYEVPRAVVSRDGGATWSEAPIPSFESRYAPNAICAGDSGRFYFVSSFGERDIGGSIEVLEGSFSGDRFEWRRLPYAIPPPFPYARSNSMDIEYDHNLGYLYVAFTRRVPPAAGYVVQNHDNEYQTVFVRSTDRGATWDPHLVLTGRESAGARIAIDRDGHVLVVWENYVLEKLMARRSTNRGASFGPEFEIGDIRDPVAIVPSGWNNFTSDRWNPVLYASQCMVAPAAFTLVVDQSDGPRQGTIYLVTTEHAEGVPGPRTGDALGVEPDDRYRSQATTLEIGHDGYGNVTGTEFSTDYDRFMFYGEAGRTIWLRGTYSASPPLDRHGAGLACVPDTTRVKGIGCFNTAPGEVAPAAIYTLPTTGSYEIGIGSFTGFSISYTLQLREFLIDPASVARDHRDILIRASTDGGQTWSPKVRVGDGPVGNEESFPEVAVDGTGRVHVAWYDRRDASECGAQIHTYWSYSDDGGHTWASSRRVSEQFSQGRDYYGWAVGDHLALAAEDERVHVAWTWIDPATEWGYIHYTSITDFPTSAQLSRLQARRMAEGVDVTWWATDVRELREFRVHRSTSGREFALVATLPPESDGEYRWMDTGASEVAPHRYRLEAVRADGASLWEGPVQVAASVRSSGLRWRAASPNPFADVVALQLETSDGAATEVSVFDVTGHEVAKLRGEPRGDHVLIRWNGRDRRGRLAAPGVYLVIARQGSAQVVRQVVRMK